MIKQLTIIVLIFLFISCKEESKTCYLTGALESAPNPTTIYLIDLENNTFLDSIVLVDGKIDFELELNHPKKVLLHNKRNKYAFRDRKILFLEPSEISINGDFEFIQNLKIKGSNSQFEFDEYSQLVDNATKQINKIKEQIHFKTDEDKKQDTIKIEQLQANLSDSIVAFMRRHPNSFVTLSSLHSESYLAFRHLDKDQINNVYKYLFDDLKNLKQGLEIKNYIDLPEPPKVGDIAPEVVQLTPNGDTIKLSDYRGKYVLLSFWSSGCGPCRAKHPRMRDIYETYNSYGLEILGVSGDNKKENWMNAIKHDSISWTNISDLKGWKNQAFLTYDVKVVPTYFLIDKNGIILKSSEDSRFNIKIEIEKIFNKNGC